MLFSLCPSLFWELRNKVNFTNCNFVLKAMRPYQITYRLSWQWSQFCRTNYVWWFLWSTAHTFEVWFEVLAEEQQVRAQMTSPLLTSGRLWLTYRLSLLVSIRSLEGITFKVNTGTFDCPFSVVEKQLITAWYKTGNIVDWWKANQRGKRTKLFAQIWPKKTNFILVCWIVGEACNAIKWREITAFWQKA